MRKYVLLAALCALCLCSCVPPSGGGSYIGAEGYAEHQRYLMDRDNSDYDLRMGRYRNVHRYGSTPYGSTYEGQKGPYQK